MTTIVWFTRDLRLHDLPALHAAARDEHVVPLFVLDEQVLRTARRRPDRVRFLLGCLRDLDASLRERGAALVIRAGDPATEVARLAAEVDAGIVHASADASGHAQRRAERTARALAGNRRELRLHPGIAVIEPGRCVPASASPAAHPPHAATFTPYFRKWLAAPKRAVLRAPHRLALPPGVDTGVIPADADLAGPPGARYLPAGGERAGRDRLNRWLRAALPHYGKRHDELSVDGTSRLSPYLHFGCISPNEVVARCDRRGEEFVRQVAWRDFYHQLLAARPECATEDYRPRGDRWHRDPDALAAWTAGRTGYPIVDAGMRQLLAEGWMHNRARLIVASFLTKDLYLDWRDGARHFLDHLIDADLASNQLNWQWVAGTGTDARPHRIFNPTRQAERFDPDGDFVRRHVPELAAIAGPAVHEPWKLPESVRRGIDYPEPIVDHDAAVRRFRAARTDD